MRRIVAALLVATALVALAVPAAHAGGRRHGHGAGVIGLAAFALFAPLIIAGEVLAHTVPFRPAVVVAPAPVYAPAPAYYSSPPPYYATAPVYSAPPTYSSQAYAAPAPQVVRYQHGRYELRGDGVHTAYQWVWIPNPPPPPPPPR